MLPIQLITNELLLLPSSSTSSYSSLLSTAATTTTTTTTTSPQITAVIFIFTIIINTKLIYCSGSLLPVVNHNNSYSSSLVKSSLGYPIMPIDDHHICTKEENYTEMIQVPVQQPVRIRTQTWCLEIPPRCSNYRTEIREVIKVENITRTRIITFCCEGYAGVLSANETICKPICRGGCGRGYCRSPDICKCDLGYIGKHCTQRCPHDKWGEDCSNDCHCRNGGVCDNKNGACRCTSGWIGDTCEQTCAPGFYGYLCKRLCECSSERCNPETGECISKETNDNSLKKNLQTIKAASDLLSESQSQSKETAQVLTSTTNSKPIYTTPSSLSDEEQPKDFEKEDTFERTYIEFGIPRISALDFTTEQTMAELILIRQETEGNPSLSPVIVTNIPTELEEDELTKINPRVIHVIDWQQQQHSNTDNATLVYTNDADGEDTSKTFENSYSGVITSFALFLIVLVVSGIGFLIFSRRTSSTDNSLPKSGKTGNPKCSGSTVVTTNAENFKTFVQPLPDLPAFTQNLRKTNDDGMLCFYVVPEFYDSPTNNSAVVKSAYTTTYGTPGPIYSSVGPKLHRKESLENHLYDEIRYPTVKSCRV